MKETSTLIIGHGEVGKGLEEILSSKYSCASVEIDGAMSQPVDHCGVINICFPYSDKFVVHVNKYIDQFKPDLTIIHSTVPVGTTKQINGLKVHSPVRGKHPNMVQGLRTYAKFVGYENLTEAVKAIWYLENAGIRCIPLEKYETTEAAKLLSLARYGMNIAFTKDQKDFCDKYGLSYDNVVKCWERTLNQGQAILGAEQFNRPVLEPLEPPIGGHCVIPVTEMLRIQFNEKQMDTNILDAILRYK